MQIIIEQSPALPGNIKALATAPPLLLGFVYGLKKFQQDTGVSVVDLTDSYSLPEFLELIEAIPNSDKRQLHFRIDFVNDAKAFGQWTRERIVDNSGSKLNGLSLTREAMLSLIQVPEETINELIQCKRDLDMWLSQLPRDRYFEQFISIENGQVVIAPDAEEKITLHFTQFANRNQTDFIREATELLNKLSNLEHHFNAHGLILRAAVQKGNEYVFESKNLIEIS